MILNTSVFKNIFENHFIGNYIDDYVCRKNMGLIEEIVSSQYLDLKKDGISFGFDENELTSINFFSDGFDDYSSFRKQLPFNLGFNFSRKNIREELGKPKRIILKDISNDIDHSDIFLFDKKYQLAVVYNNNCDRILFFQIAAPPIIA